MKGTRLAAHLLLLGGLLAAAVALDMAGYLNVAGGLEPLGARQFAIVSGLFFAAACLGSLFPAARLRILLAFSLAQIVFLFGPLQVAGALVVWIAFYGVVHARASWGLKLPLLAGLYVTTILLGASSRASTAFEILLVVFYASNFILRLPLYVYEAVFKRSQLEGAGLAGFLTYLIALPLSSLNVAPVGFAVLHRGYSSELRPELMRRGLARMAHGLLYLVVGRILAKSGLFPSVSVIAAYSGEMDVVSALASCHVILLSLFLSTAGYIHTAVGMLYVLGFDIPPGMRMPYRSTNVLEFWRRWNIYWRDCLMTLAYYPLAMPLRRRPVLAAAVAGMATFLFGGFTHAVRYYVKWPSEITLEGFLAAHFNMLAFGTVVTAMLLREAIRAKKPREDTRDAGGSRALRFAGEFLSIAATLTVVALILALFARPFGFPDEAAFRLVAALFRLPEW